MSGSARASSLASKKKGSREKNDGEAEGLSRHRSLEQTLE